MDSGKDGELPQRPARRADSRKQEDSAGGSTSGGGQRSSSPLVPVRLAKPRRVTTMARSTSAPAENSSDASAATATAAATPPAGEPKTTPASVVLRGLRAARDQHDQRRSGGDFSGLLLQGSGSGGSGTDSPYAEPADSLRRPPPASAPASAHDVVGSLGDAQAARTVVYVPGSGQETGTDDVDDGGAHYAAVVKPSKLKPLVEEEPADEGAAAVSGSDQLVYDALWPGEVRGDSSSNNSSDSSGSATGSKATPSSNKAAHDYVEPTLGPREEQLYAVPTAARTDNDGEEEAANPTFVRHGPRHRSVDSSGYEKPSDRQSLALPPAGSLTLNVAPTRSSVYSCLWPEPADDDDPDHNLPSLLVRKHSKPRARQQYRRISGMDIVAGAAPDRQSTTGEILAREAEDQTHADLVRVDSLLAAARPARAKSAPAPVGSNLAAPPVPPGRPPARPLKTCSAYTSEILGTEVLEKSGMLAKQSLVLKTWRTRWVVLRDGKMYYFREPEDSRRSRRALGVIVLDDLVRVRRATTSDGLGRPHAMIITTPSRTHVFSAESLEEAEAWLGAVVRVVQLSKPDKRYVNDIKISGYVRKSKNGYMRTRYARLICRTLFFSKGEYSNSVSHVSLSDCPVLPMDADLESDVEEDAPDYHDSALCISSPQGIYYLMFSSREERDKWAYFCMMASGVFSVETGTPTEQVLRRLEELDAQSLSHPDLANPIFSFTNEPLKQPLTTLPTAELEAAALQLWKSLQLYTGVVIDKTASDYHVLLAQYIVDQCLQQPELQNEVYCQLIRLSTNHPYPSSALAAQCWQLLTLCIPVFLPTLFFRRFLVLHLERHASPDSETGKYALYGLRCLDRFNENGGRSFPPSRVEILSVITRNPHAHEQSMSIPVHLSPGSHYLAGFDPSTTVYEFLEGINTALGLRPIHDSGFALYSNDPQFVESSVEHSLRNSDKLCDIISKWERLNRELRPGLVDSALLPRFYFKKRLRIRIREGASDQELPNDLEDVLTVYQVQLDIMAGRFPLHPDDAVELAAVLCQLEWGDAASCEDQGASIQEAKKKFLPEKVLVKICGQSAAGQAAKMAKRAASAEAALEGRLLARWKSLHKFETGKLANLYLTVAERWKYFHATLFEAEIVGSMGPGGQEVQAWLAVEEDKLSVLSRDFEPLHAFHYRQLRHFGTSAGDFRIVVRTDKGKFQFLFRLEKKSEATLLVASYINRIIAREGITSGAASAHQTLQVLDLETAGPSGHSLNVYGRPGQLPGTAAGGASAKK